MTEEQLRQLCFGVYQIKQARTYSEAHLNKNDGDYEVELTKENETLIRCKIDSRHSNSTQYYCWIEFAMDEIVTSGSDSDNDDDTLVEKFHEKQPIKSWYCQCPAGEQTCGCCVHVTCVLWFLGYARHHQFTPSAYKQRYRETLVGMDTS
ncbi:unnamed protein product [Didymodactylos carnosus]|uniref:SWIM-type domain-containing protein n=1 Tax=Didymodactylos carnosus TaxID=1234261 RepID=A0A815HTJ8_9BILA|nr:unnamed protein product [Didymodactylos carnosus]CAF1356836.1 unnamed protein product [Didymodactylos carnosus]CAF4034603.1 unnamed protein product [Didymodactylos carnosus]CAF4231098.1 unnamed protein product [Didymodactylos carnosus]